MTKKISLLTLMLISAFTSKAATLSEKIDSFFKPIVENYLVPVIFWDPIKAMGFDVGASIPIVVVWLVFGAIYFTFRMNFINFMIVKFLVKVKFANIINIINNKEVIPELIQNECNSKEIFKSVIYFLKNPALMDKQINDFSNTLNEMRSKTSSADEASSIILKYLT